MTGVITIMTGIPIYYWQEVAPIFIKIMAMVLFHINQVQVLQIYLKLQATGPIWITMETLMSF